MLIPSVWISFGCILIGSVCNEVNYSFYLINKKYRCVLEVSLSLSFFILEIIIDLKGEDLFSILRLLDSIFYCIIISLKCILCKFKAIFKYCCLNINLTELFNIDSHSFLK